MDSEKIPTHILPLILSLSLYIYEDILSYKKNY